MERKCFTRVLQVAVVSLTLAAILQELEQPQEERQWHGKVAAFIPYDFRLPSIERIKEAYWNPYERRVLTPEVFGIGWAINFHALLENLGIIKRDVSEESFLMPTPSMKEALSQYEPTA
jgi:hypothetical protein